MWPRVLLAFGAGLTLPFALAAGALIAWDAGYEGRILNGVSVGAVDLSGMDRSQAASALTAAFDGYSEGRIVVRTSAGEVIVPFEAFARRADVQAMVDAAVRAGRSGNALERAVGEVRLAMSGVTLEPALVLDEAAVVARVRSALATLGRAPVDSRVAMVAGVVHVTPGRPGRTFDGAAAAAAALQVVGRLDAPREVVVEAAEQALLPEHDDDEAYAAQAAATRMATEPIVVFLGDKEWTLKARTVRGWLHLAPGPDGAPWPVADRDRIAASLKKIAKAVLREPVSATFLKDRGGRVVGVIASRDGRLLDARATAESIATALAQRAHRLAVEPVKARVTKVQPERTTEEALAKGPLMTRLGTWKTWFPVSERNYFGANIWLPAKKIDGTVLRPGQTFEWWSALGPVSPATGYGPGGFIAGNHTEPTGALGGGMCSSSTTLFNAALRAGLKMGARANHRYYIDRYPLGLDATVSKTRNGSQTVSFTNDMAHPIVIRTFRYRSGGRGWVRYEIWGIPDGRKVTIGKPMVTNVRKATTQTVYVSTLRPGVREQVEYPANGMDVAVSRTVRAANGRLLHSETYRTRYALWNGRIEIGQ